MQDLTWSCRHFENVLHSLPLLVVASSPDTADQALEDLHEASKGQLQHVQCLLLQFSRPAAHSKPAHSSPLAIAPSGRSRHINAGHGLVRGQEAADMVTIDSQEEAISVQAQGSQDRPADSDSAKLACALQWVASNCPQQPAMQVTKF